MTTATTDAPKTANLFLGYIVEKVTERYRGAYETAYLLHGPRATYTLIRRPDGTMYACNSRGNICGVKGNYTFGDDGGTLRCIY